MARSLPFLVAALALGALAGCGSSSDEPADTKTAGQAAVMPDSQLKPPPDAPGMKGGKTAVNPN